MRMVAAVIGRLIAQVDWLGPTTGGHPALSLHRSNEPGELTQWLWAMMTTPSSLLVIINKTKQNKTKLTSVSLWCISHRYKQQKSKGCLKVLSTFIPASGQS